MANDWLSKLSMSTEQASEELAAIRRKLREIDQRWSDHCAEQRELQERYDAIEGELNAHRLQGWLGQYVMLTYTPSDRNLRVAKPTRGTIGRLVKVHRKYAIVDFGDKRLWKVPVIALRGVDHPLDGRKPPEAEPVPDWRQSDKPLDPKDEA
jgi:hypothetical protein